jgi:asparagine synthase (glutamine-hydrolysing)
MGGIGGVRTFTAGTFAANALDQMAQLLQHRGPDASGVWVGPDVGLSHTRLAVTDDDVHQPMHSVDGRWVLVLDGRVLNHESLRGRLDYPFRTRSDAEVVLAGLALEGISFVGSLQGQFALVAHDLRTDTTHLVRDPLGIRPLHYRHVAGGIAFGSEVKALLAVGPRPEVDHRSLDAYLTHREVAAPDTLFEGVKKVRPAHRVSIMSAGHLEEVPYWSPPEMDPEGTWSAEDAVEAVSDGVREAVRSALITDVPVGVLLSGGLDSSLVVAHVRHLRGDEPVHTFSAELDDHASDRLEWGRRVGTLLATQHHEVQVRAADFEDLWGRLTWHRDAPIPEPTDVTAYGLARAAREHVGIALSGAGGDELFGGYPEHRYARLAERAAVLPTRVRTTLVGRVERRLGAGGPPAYWGDSFTPAERQRLLGSSREPGRRTSPGIGADPVDRVLRHDLRHWLPDTLLERADRMSMAASLELLHPLLDHRLVELAFRLPSGVKVHAGTTKWVLRQAARPMLPDDVIDRRASHVRVRLDTWFRSGLGRTARDRLTDPASWVARNLDTSLVLDLVDQHEHGSGDDARLWTLLCLEVWHDCFFGPSPTVPRPRGPSPVPAPLREP